MTNLSFMDDGFGRFRKILRCQPDFAAAKANLDLVQKLIPPKPKDDDQDVQDPNQKPDDVTFDDKGTWLIRFHLFENCLDFDPASPHGHAAFFISVP